MSLLRRAIALMALATALASPALASAESIVPPGNSAATQYTETFPSSQGNVEVNSGIGGGGRSPEQALGKPTAHALESQGREGRAVAALAAEAAPGGAAGEPGNGGSGHHGAAAGAGGSNGAGGSGGSGASSPGGSGSGALPSGSGAVAVSASSGSGGLGQVVSHATLSDSGEMGVFLPLILTAALIWSVLYAWRRRQRSATQA